MNLATIVAEGICAVRHEAHPGDGMRTRFEKVADELDEAEFLAAVATAMYSIGFTDGEEYAERQK